MKSTSLKDKLRYYFENTLSDGPIGVIKWLGIASLSLVIILGIVILIFGIKASPDPSAENLGFIEGAWQSLMATLDSGTMGGDEGWSFRTVRFIATLGGIFVISILIGTISSGIDSKIDDLKKGKSKVLENGHTLILGWSEKIFTIIDEIAEANSNKKNQKIVIMADRDKAEMEDEIREKVNNRQNTKIIVRSGNPLEASSVSVVNPNDARSIIVLGNEEAMTDTYVIKTILSLTNGKNRKKEKYNIVAEIKDPKNMEAAELVGNNEAVFILTSDIISRITAQTCRQSGLSVVYSELLQFKGDEIYFQSEPKLEGLTYKEVLFQYEQSAVIGILSKSDEALINPPMDTIFNSGDQVIAISEDDDTITINTDKMAAVDHSAIIKSSKPTSGSEKTLILGWNERGARIIREMENYVGPGSSVTILAKTDSINEDLEAISTVNQSIIVVEGDINDKATLTNIKTEDFDHIILLSYKDMDVQESDAKTLICLLHLRNLSEQANKDYCIVSEMLDIRNRELGVIAKADDFIVGDNLISLILSQLSENKALKKVYDVLFAADGSEIYLKPVSHYVKIGVPINFYTVLESAAQSGETAIGYRLSSQSDDSEKQFGVVLNPDKSKSVVFAENDYIIVVAEN